MTARTMSFASDGAQEKLCTILAALESRHMEALELATALGVSRRLIYLYLHRLEDTRCIRVVDTVMRHGKPTGPICTFGCARIRGVDTLDIPSFVVADADPRGSGGCASSPPCAAKRQAAAGTTARFRSDAVRRGPRLMDCPDCTQALIEPWDGYTNSCSGCEKRMLACMVEAIAAGQENDESRGENTMMNEADNILDDLLCKWHGWARDRAANGVDRLGAETSPKAQSRWEMADEDADAQLHANTMKAVDFHITGDGRGQGAMPEPYRAAISTLARNCYTGRKVWLSPRLPADPLELSVVIQEARNMLMRRLISAGIV